jgi:hypothetical protein
MRASLLLPTALLTLVASSPLRAQEAAPRILRINSEFAEPFSKINGLIELNDGRLLVADRREQAVRLVDLAKGRLQDAARSGKGPLEYNSPGGFYRMRNGEIRMIDQTLRRYLVFSAQGRPLRTEPFAEVSTGARLSSASGDPHELDDTGAEVVRPTMNMGREVARDSGWVIRRHGTSVDSLMRLRLPESVTNSAGGARVTAIKRFSPADGAATASDGRIAVVRAEPYRVEWWRAGQRLVQGPVIPYDALKVTDADRAEAEKARAQVTMPGGIRVMQSDGNGGQKPLDVGSLVPPMQMAETKPAFDPMQIRIDLQGRVWVRRYTVPGVDHVYDIFDGEGRRVDRVQLPQDSALAGFGKGVVYVVRTDADELLYLGRISY